MTDRRLWNKSNTDFNFEYPNHADNYKETESQKRYEEYLFNLHLNNQLSKIVKKKDKKEEELEKLEGGFNLYVNGAHKKNAKYTPRLTTAKSSINSSSSSNKNFSKLNLESLNSSRSPSTTPAVTTRKKWSNSSFIFKTSDGCEIKINSPSHYQKAEIKTSNQSNECEYSDDFESDDESNDKNLIESVKFSDQESSDEDDIKINKKLTYKLTKNDVKLLRESFNELNDSIKSDESLHKKENDLTSEFDLVNKKLQPSAICNMILEKASFLKRKDRENLVEFLSKIDEH